MALKLKINQKSLKLIISITTSLSSFLLIATGWQDFQNAKIYETSTNLNNQPTYRTIERQFDRQNHHLPPNTKIIARIDRGNPYTKIFLMLAGLSTSIAGLVLISQEEKWEEIFQYIQEKENEAKRLDIDNEMAVLDYTKGEHLLIRGTEELAELRKNPWYIMLQKGKEDIINSQYEDEEDEPDEPDEEGSIDLTEDIKDDIWTDTQPKEEKQVILCTRKQAETIYKAQKQEQIPLYQAIQKVTNINSTNSDWKEFKAQLIKHLEDITNA